MWLWLLLLLPTLTSAATVPLAPGPLQPALATLRPGDTLVLQSGAYPPAAILCGENAVSGTAAQPITMRAAAERQAQLQGSGGPALIIEGCQYWIIEGLTLTTTDNDAQYQGNGNTVAIYRSSHITLRRNLIAHANRHTNAHCLALMYNVDGTLVEENEIYDCHRHGILLFGNSPETVPAGNVIRRNYLHGRHATGNLPPGEDVHPEGPDTAISCYPCQGTIVENNIVEGWHAGYDMQAKTRAIGNRYLGNIALGTKFGILFSTRDDLSNSLDSMPQGTQVTNFVSVDAGIHGVYFRSNKHSRCDNCTLIGSGSHGFIADAYRGTNIGDSAPMVAGSNILSVQNGGAGGRSIDQASASFASVNVWGNSSETFDAAAPLLRVDPKLGACTAWIPTDSPMKQAGTNGQDIGANVLYRYEGGTLTTKPLWQGSGQFSGCGAIVPGVNDVAGASCRDVHQRLNVNTGGCMFPAGYGEDLPTPRNLRAVSR